MKKIYSLSSVLVGFITAPTHANPSATPDVEFDWDTINPSHNLEYHNCYEDLQCARLLLPMDWLNATKNETVAIAMIKLPAVVDDNDPAFGGTIIAQPGGPAVSGTSYGRGIAHKLQNLFDIPGKKHYEMISFDTRGTGKSLPQINCFPHVLGYIRTVEAMTNGALDLSSANLAFSIAAAKADGIKCEMTHGEYLSYVGTPNSARDMVAMIDKIEEMRGENAKPRAQAVYQDDDTSRLELRSTEKSDDKVPRLQYIGISYGTLLGNYFASMFPGRVGRMVLDGVMDADDSAHGLGWFTNTIDTDEMVTVFFQGCFTAGPATCALYRKQDKSGSDISQRFWSWANNLDEQPLIIMTPDGGRLFVRSGEIRALFQWAMYNAVYDSQPFAVDINHAMHGNTTGLLARVCEFYQIAPLGKDCSKYSSNPLIPTDAQTAIICIDGDDVTNFTNDKWRAYLAKQLSISSVAGAFWTTLRLACVGWRSRPNWIFKGPFTTPKATSPPVAGRPAAPLLFMSNRYDPATPVRNARAMAKSHPDAGVLVHESMGHCVILGPMGSCVRGVLSRYFDTGHVPSEEVTCEAVRGPWDEI